MGVIACAALAVLTAIAAPQDPADGATVVLPPALSAEPAPAAVAAPSPETPRPSPALALPAEEPRRPSRLLEDHADPGPSLGGFLVASIAVVALLGGAFLVLRRYGKHSRILGGGNPIQVLAHKALGQKQEIFLVEVGARVFMIGSTRERLATLGEFSAPDEVAALKTRLPGAQEGSARLEFGESLREGLREAEGLAVDAPAKAAPREDRVFASIADELAEIRRTVRAWRA